MDINPDFDAGSPEGKQAVYNYQLQLQEATEINQFLTTTQAGRNFSAFLAAKKQQMYNTFVDPSAGADKLQMASVQARVWEEVGNYFFEAIKRGERAHLTLNSLKSE